VAFQWQSNPGTSLCGAKRLGDGVTQFTCWCKKRINQAGGGGILRSEDTATCSRNRNRPSSDRMTTVSRPHSTLARHKISRGRPMYAYSNETPRLFVPIDAKRWNHRRRRIRSRLRGLGRAVVSSVATIWTGLIRALRESRSRSAARLLYQHRHLIQDSHSADDAGSQSRKSSPGEG
jgi:hypothetical protein